MNSSLEDSARDVSIASPQPKCQSKEKGEAGLVGAKGLQLVSYDWMQGFVRKGLTLNRLHKLFIWRMQHAIHYYLKEMTGMPYQCDGGSLYRIWHLRYYATFPFGRRVREWVAHFCLSRGGGGGVFNASWRAWCGPLFTARHVVQCQYGAYLGAP